MPNRHIIVVGASAGGVEALQALARTLPADFPGTLFVTMHFPSHGTSVLPRILSRVSDVPASHAIDGEPILPGRIYVAPPDFHLLLTTEGIHLARGPKESGHRPAVDPMFRSAAVAFGPRVIGVVLTGSLDDGTAGMAAIKRRGGLAVIQDPDESLFPSMPQSVREHVHVDRVVGIRDLARTLRELMDEPLPVRAPPVTQSDAMENEFAAGSLDAMAADTEHPGKVSAYGCPDCGGVLWELKDEEFTRFRCRVGHAWTSDALLAEQAETLDQALWVALRALEESAALSRSIAERHKRRGGGDRLASKFVEQADSMDQRAQVIRDALMVDRDVQVTPDLATATPRRDRPQPN